MIPTSTPMPSLNLDPSSILQANLNLATIILVFIAILVLIAPVLVFLYRAKHGM
jgi:hypothetical protein